jgi:parallel beta-helix repeat protein
MNTESYCNTIQDAVNAASAGDTIIVGSGTYNEQVTVDKPLTIIGEDRAGTVVESYDYLYAFFVTADGVTISNLTVVQVAADSGMYFDGAIGIYMYRDACIVENVDISGFGYGILAEYCTDVVISGSDLSSNGYGIYVDGCTGVTVTDTVTSSNAFNGITVLASSDMSISGGEMSFNGMYGVYADYCTGVTVSGQDTSSDIALFSLDAGSDCSILSNGYGSIYLHSCTDAGNVANLNTNLGYYTIQDAVDAASAGDTIIVGSGTYNEQVTVDKPLTIIGEDRAGTVVESYDYLYAFFVTADGVTISNLTVVQVAADSGMYFDGAIGIYLLGVDNCIVENVDISGFGYALLAEYCTDVVISGSDLSSNGYGIYVDGCTGVTVTDTVALSNVFDGLHMHSSDVVSISFDEMSFNGMYGIYADSCNRVRMLSSNISMNCCGDLYMC